MDRELSKKILFLFAIVIFVLLVVLPLGYTFFETFFIGQQISLNHYVEIFTKGNLRLLFWSSLMAATVGLICTLAGGAIGFLLSKTDLPFSGSLKLLLLIPLLVSPYYFAVAWRDFFIVIGQERIMQGSLASVGFILTLCYMPLSMLIFSSAFTGINSKLEEAGLLIASRTQVFKSITLPLVKPAIFSSFILVFILAISEMSVASYYIVKSYTSEIFIQFSAFYNHETAIATSSLLILLCLSLLLFERSYLVHAPFLSISSKGNIFKKTALKNWRTPVLAMLLTYLIMTIVTPLIVLAIQAFEKPVPAALQPGNIPQWRLMEMPEGMDEKGFYFKEAFKRLEPVIRESLLYAFIGAALLCILGFIYAYYNNQRKQKSFDLVLLFVFAVPSTVLGVSMIKFYNQPSLKFIYGTFAIVLIGYIGKFAFIASKVIGHSMKQIPRSLEEAAALSGAGLFLRLRKIIFPLVMDGFFVAFILCFVFCLGEIAVSIVVYPPGTSLLPIQIATSMHNTPDGLISAMVLIALTVTMLALAALFLVRKYFLSKMNHGWNQF